MAAHSKNPATNSIPPDPDATLTVVAWRDELVENDPRSHPTSSSDTLVWWTPILGPSATLLAHRFAGYVARGAQQQFTVADVARTLGMGQSTSRVRATLDRLARFGVVTLYGQTVHVRVALPPLTERQAEQLPAYLAALYEQRTRTNVSAVGSGRRG